MALRANVPGRRTPCRATPEVGARRRSQPRRVNASAIVVRRAMDIGADVVSVASTGNAASSLACVAASVGLPAVVFVPETAPPAKLTQSLSYGATVLAVRGNYDDAFDLCLTASQEFGWFNRSTGYNPFTREGKKVCAFEIWESLDGRAPDRVLVPTGDGNLLLTPDAYLDHLAAAWEVTQRTIKGQLNE